MRDTSQPADTPDVVLIGAGIMSATLGIMLKLLEPRFTIHIYERLNEVAKESTDAWNNAGTGHSAFCELNYTPQRKDGTIDITKALLINEHFEVSRQFWSYLIEHGIIQSPKSFINNVPHISFVWGADNVSFLRKRYEAMHKHHFFQDMQYSEDREQITRWIPLIMGGRPAAEKIAATRMEAGTDVNFGALTRALFRYLETQDGVTLYLGHQVKNLIRDGSGWRITVKERASGKKRHIHTPFVFIGAGGGAMPLLEKSGIPEGTGYAGFPVSGQWLRCTNKKVINKHGAKVYGKASVGSPPMSVPHLDTRIINGKKNMLFGPFAGFSTKFLKKGSALDLPLSIRANNLVPMLSAGMHNVPLIKYLVSQVIQSSADRISALRQYYPKAKSSDWELVKAGMRVQVIKKDPEEGGILEFGTEVVTAADGSLAALLGASPGASIAASVMVELIEKCFKEQAATAQWQAKLKQMIPSYGLSLKDNETLSHNIKNHTNKVLRLTD